MLPEWGDTTRCPTCAEDNRRKARTVWKRDVVKKVAAQARYRKRKTAELVAAGLCVRCEDESEVREDGKRRERCVACTKYAAEQQRDRWLRRRAKRLRFREWRAQRRLAA